MHILIIRVSLLSVLFSLLVLNAAYGQGFLRAEGQRIVDENGNEVLLRGIGLGGWMLQEGYMLRTQGPQHRIEARIEDLIGPERKRAFYDAWLANHTRQIDIDSMAGWGFNSVRLPMHYKWFTPPIEEEPVAGEITWNDRGFEMVDRLLGWAGANEMYLILDLHAAPGGQGKNADINDYDPEKPSLWESEANQEKTIALWRKLAERYADEPWMGGYDLINEPNWGFEDLEADPNGCSETSNAPIWDLSRRITEAIREVDGNHLIIIEGNCWGNNYRGLPELWDDNLVISYHKYWNYNDQASIQAMLDMRAERNVPIWLGESGENSNTWYTDAIRLLEENDIGWAWWPLKKMGINQPLEIIINPGYRAIQDYWRGDGERPSADEAYAALMQLAEDLKFENNIFHRGVVDAMIRQPRSAEAVPYRDHRISSETSTRILAVDYDMGPHGVAYYDTAVANYRVSTGGPSTAWNEGRAYRNDGVDIDPGTRGVEDDLSVGWTEAGEWLQFTVDVLQEGVYSIGLRSGAARNGGRVSILVDGAPLAESVPLPETDGQYVWATTRIGDVSLGAGIRRVKVTVEEGGFNLRALEFTPALASHPD